jgi:hypothetical protein
MTEYWQWAVALWAGLCTVGVLGWCRAWEAAERARYLRLGETLGPDPEPAEETGSPT